MDTAEGWGMWTQHGPSIQIYVPSLKKKKYSGPRQSNSAFQTCQMIKYESETRGRDDAQSRGRL